MLSERAQTLLKILVADCRTSQRQIATMLGVSAPTVGERIRIGLRRVVGNPDDGVDTRVSRKAAMPIEPPTRVVAPPWPVVAKSVEVRVLTRRSAAVDHVCQRVQIHERPIGKPAHARRTVGKGRHRNAGENEVEVTFSGEVWQDAFEGGLRTIHDLDAVSISRGHSALSRGEECKRHRQGTEGHHDEQHDDQRDAIFGVALQAVGVVHRSRFSATDSNSWA